MIFSTLPKYRGPFEVACIDVEQQSSKAVILKLFYPTKNNNQNYANFFPHPTNKYCKGFTDYIRINEYVGSAISYLLSRFPKISALRGNGSDLLLPAPNSSEKYPVMVFSHGLAGNRCMYSSFCGDMASYGIVVCTIEHRDQSASYSWTQSEPQDVPYLRQPTSLTEKQFRGDQIKVRVEEIELAWKFLNQLNSGDFEKDTILFNPNSPDYIANPTLTPFKNQLDLQNPILTGHSFGGATILEYLSREDHPFKCAVAMDPWMTPIDPKPVKTPILSINTEGFTKWVENFDIVNEHMKSIRSINSNAHLATVNNTVHVHQSDGPSIAYGITKLLRRPVNIHPHKATELNNGLAISFISEMLNSLPYFKDSKLNIPNWNFLKSEKLWKEELYFHN